MVTDLNNLYLKPLIGESLDIRDNNNSATFSSYPKIFSATMISLSATFSVVADFQAK